MTDRVESCDRCGAAVVIDRFDTSGTSVAVITKSSDDGHPLYEEVQRLLCSACKRDLLEWIDSGEIDRSECVDLPTHVEAAESLRHAASELEEYADMLNRELDAGSE
jgi:hypothetical protein